MALQFMYTFMIMIPLALTGVYFFDGILERASVAFSLLALISILGAFISAIFAVWGF